MENKVIEAKVEDFLNSILTEAMVAEDELETADFAISW